MWINGPYGVDATMTLNLIYLKADSHAEITIRPPRDDEAKIRIIPAYKATVITCTRMKRA